MTSTELYKAIQGLVIRNRAVILAVVVVLQACLSNFLAFSIRFEFILSPHYFRQFLLHLPLLVAIRFGLYFGAGLHRGLFRYASISDLIKTVTSGTIGSMIFLVILRYLFRNTSYPNSVLILDWLLFVVLSGGTRVLLRIFREYLYFTSASKKILIIGASDAAEIIVRKMKNHQGYVLEPIGFIDIDLENKGRTIHGLPILGNIPMLPKIIREHKPDEILVSDTTNTHKTIKEVYDLCKPFNIPIKKIPGIDDLLDGNVSVAGKLGQQLVDANLVSEEQVREALALQRSEGGRLGSKLVKLGHIKEEKLISFLKARFGISHMKPISLDDLLQRDTVKTDIASVRELVSGKSVLVTGAGGSIGSELCRQISKYMPDNLILLDRYENNLYELERALREEFPKNVISTAIADIQDPADLAFVFSTNRPQIVFHAAAYKHVPLMECNPIVAVKNNVLGTRNLLDTAVKWQVERFVMISTDKAVNPTSVMGATKRIAEFLTLSMNSRCSTMFTTVRFGNVLGTNGSVIPIFKQQLMNGGPLTVTHSEIKRYFMLIPEAVQLVLIASASGNGGEIFVLDMGEQIRIYDLAEHYIRLSGFIPHKEVKIVISGLRPGEKLYEELFDETEKIMPTSHEKLRLAVPHVPDSAVLDRHIAEFERIVRDYSMAEVYEEIQRIVPNFRYQEVPSLPVDGYSSTLY